MDVFDVSFQDETDISMNIFVDFESDKNNNVHKIQLI